MSISESCKKVHKEGYIANDEGELLDNNPYDKHVDEHLSWDEGWLAAEDDFSLRRKQ